MKSTHVSLQAFDVATYQAALTLFCRLDPFACIKTGPREAQLTDSDLVNLFHCFGHLCTIKKTDTEVSLINNADGGRCVTYDASREIITGPVDLTFDEAFQMIHIAQEIAGWRAVILKDVPSSGVSNALCGAYQTYIAQLTSDDSLVECCCDHEHFTRRPLGVRVEQFKIYDHDGAPLVMRCSPVGKKSAQQHLMPEPDAQKPDGLSTLRGVIARRLAGLRSP